MYTFQELHQCLKERWFVNDYKALEQSLIRRRLALDVQPSDSPSRGLSRFSQAVLASVGSWNLDDADVRRTCALAGDIEAGSAKIKTTKRAAIHLFSAAILYDLARLPAAAASMAQRETLSEEYRDFFARTATSSWGRIHSEIPVQRSTTSNWSAHGSVANYAIRAFAELLDEFGLELQHEHRFLSRAGVSAAETLQRFLATFSCEITCDVVKAALTAIELRRINATAKALSHTNLDRSVLAKLGAPVELWPAQRAALECGLLDKSNRSFGLAAPTGTGKTALTRILLADFFQANPGRKALYVSPSRALTSQIAHDLDAALSGLGISVSALGAALTVNTQNQLDAVDADVLVFTPEKADLILRVQKEVIDDAGLVIVDEAHHIEQGTRGILLEFYLWRLRSLLPKDARIVQLSAVAPNISELVEWLAPSSDAAFAKVDCRSGRLRMAEFERASDGAGVLRFVDGVEYQIFGPKQCASNPEENLAQLAERLSKTGIVLVLTTSVKRAEELATAIAAARSAFEPQDKVVAERLDARIERELYPECPLRELVKRRVAFHHARLPPRIRIALEQAISAREVDVVCATTTLAEGVNFPFATVVVETLIGKSFQLTPRALWNIAGRAGRFGVDSEGHCILFRPSAWKSRLTHYNYEEYLTTTLDGIPPVRSALHQAIAELKKSVDSQQLSMTDLEAISLNLKIGGKVTPEAKRIRGLLNMMRVGYAHAFVSKTISLDEKRGEEFRDKVLLAARQMSPGLRSFASKVALQQRAVIKRAVEDNDELVGIAAQIGWTLETQSALYEWVSSLDDNKLKTFGSITMGGRLIRTNTLRNLLWEIASRMTEFEGDVLGGPTCYVATGWVHGHPLTSIQGVQKIKPSFNRLVEVIYARVQYMLPWALYGVNELIQYVARERGIRVSGGLSDLAALASEGVPDYDALNLVLRLDVERVDATRLSEAYRRNTLNTDIIGWFKSRPWATIAGIVRAPDQRRIDPDLKVLWDRLRNGA